MSFYSRASGGGRYGFRRMRRRYAGRFKSSRFGGSLRGRSRVSALTRAVAGLQAHARRVGNPERKWIDVQESDTLIPTGSPPTTNIITDIASNFATGAGASGVGQPGQMVGNRIRIDSIQLQGEFHLDAAAATFGGSSLRIVLYEDTDPNGTVATPAQIFNLDTTVASPQVMTYSMRNMSFATRFRVLWDYKETLSSEGLTSLVFNKYFKIGRTIQFATNGSGSVVAGTTGTNRTFGILVILDPSVTQGGAPPGSLNEVPYNIMARLRYTDN